MSLVFTVGSGGVPVGNYTATFVGTEPQAADTAKGYSAGLRWKFKIDAGPQTGQTASRITGLSPTADNPCGKMITGLLGRGLKEGEQLDLSSYVGKRYMIVVAAGPKGGIRVEAIVPIP